MIQLGSYTKEEIAIELNYNTDKASNITKKLTNLGYKYSTNGKGRNYTITIMALPSLTIKKFAEEHLGISARFEDRLIHFLQLLFSTGNDDYANMSASSLEWLTYSNNDTIQNWLYSLIDCGLLVEENWEEVYYATRKVQVSSDEDGNYDYTQEVKFISRFEYEKAIRAYSECVLNYGDISKNPDVVFDEMVFEANLAKKQALDGWWAMRKTANYKITINKEWKYYQQLLSLLEQFEVQEYHMLKQGNFLVDEARWIERMERWEREKEEKRKKLLAKTQNEIKYNEHKKVLVEEEYYRVPPAKIRSNDEIEVSNGFQEYLEQLNEKYYLTKKGFFEYEGEN